MLWSFVAVQPLLDLLGDAPEFFVARQNTRGDIVLLAISLTLVPPLVATAIEALVRRISPTVQGGLHLALVSVLVAAFALQVLSDRPGGPSAVLIPLALALGAGAAVAYTRTRLAPMLLTALAPAPLVFVLVFLLVSPVSKLVLRTDEAVAADVAIPGDTPVVMIVFDEFSGISLMGPDRRIDARRLPSFDRLARDATWYRNASTVSDFTDRAVPALLTGERPERGSVPTAADHPESLFTLLGRSYDFNVTEPVTDLCPQRLCPAETAERIPARQRLEDLVSDLSLVSLHLLVPDDLRRGLTPIDRSFGDFRAADAAGRERNEQPSGDKVRQSAAFLALVARDEQFAAFAHRLGRRPTHRPRLSFLHTQLPHNPYVYLPSGQKYPEIASGLPGLEDQPGTPAGVWRPDRALAGQGQERYLLQVGYADRQLGRLLARLRDSGQYDRSLIVVMADHGVSFEPGTPHRAVTTGNIAQIASIPLLVKAPNQHAGRVDDTNVSSIDVLPTLASLLGTKLPWRVDGSRASRSRSRTITLQPRAGEGTLSIPFAEFVRRRDAAAARQSADFRLGVRSPQSRAVPDADLVGRQLSDLEVQPSQGRVELEDTDALRSVDPHGATVPFVLSGRLTDERPGERLAIAVNGRVAAVVRPFLEGDDLRFSALAPPERFARGANRVDVVQVTGAGTNRRLALLGTGDVDPQLVRETDGEAIVEAGGHRIPIAPGVEGNVDHTGGSRGLVTLKGWAADTQRRRRAERVIAFSGTRFVGSTRPAEPRPDLAKLFGPGLATAGFTVGGARARVPKGAPEAKLRVFAVLDGKASAIKGVR